MKSQRSKGRKKKKKKKKKTCIFLAKVFCFLNHFIFVTSSYPFSFLVSFFLSFFDSVLFYFLSFCNSLFLSFIIISFVFLKSFFILFTFFLYIYLLLTFCLLLFVSFFNKFFRPSFPLKCVTCVCGDRWLANIPNFKKICKQFVQKNF